MRMGKSFKDGSYFDELTFLPTVSSWTYKNEKGELIATIGSGSDGSFHFTPAKGTIVTPADQQDTYRKVYDFLKLYFEEE